MSESGQDNPISAGDSGELIKGGTFKEVTVPFTERGSASIGLPDLISQSPSSATFIQDHHSDPRIRHVMWYPEMKKLTELGITHYLIEAPTTSQELLDQLGTGKSVDLYNNPNLGPLSSGDRSFADAIYAMAGSGIKVQAIDHPGTGLPNSKVPPQEREEFIHTQVRGVLDAGGKAVILIGGFHAANEDIISGFPSVAKRLVQDGQSVTSIRFTSPTTPPAHARLLIPPVAKM